MQRPHRLAHRAIWFALAVLVPLGFLAALLVRQERPVQVLDPAVLRAPETPGTGQ